MGDSYWFSSELPSGLPASARRAADMVYIRGLSDRAGKETGEPEDEVGEGTSGDNLQQGFLPLKGARGKLNTRYDKVIVCKA